jgi:hypothetical protein
MCRESVERKVAQEMESVVMGTEADELFITVCFLSLMEGGGGLLQKSPAYLMEKKCSSMEHAFTQLDGTNQRRVLQWYALWRVELPEVVRHWLEL